MHIALLLLVERALRMRLALGRRVVVAQEQAGVGGQIEQGADRPVELARVAPWEVHSRGARFRGKHRIAHERGVTNEIGQTIVGVTRSEEHTSELQSLMPISYAVFC